MQDRREVSLLHIARNYIILYKILIASSYLTEALCLLAK